MPEIRKYVLYLLFHIKVRFIWFKKWVILIRTIPRNEPVPSAPAGHILRPADFDDYPALIAVYPEEFCHHLPETIKQRKLMQRARRNARCFVVTDDAGQIKGATWCEPYKNAAIKPDGVDQDSVFEMVNTFIVDEARGAGLSGCLRRFAIASMAALGYRAVISFVWYSRTGSLKMNMNTGSRILGEKTLYSVLGRRWTRLRPHVDLNRLPLLFKGRVFLLGGNETILRRLSLELRGYGIVHAAVPIGLGIFPAIKLRLSGCKVLNVARISGQNSLHLPPLSAEERGFLVPVDAVGEEELTAWENAGILGDYESLRLSTRQLEVSSAGNSELPHAILDAAGVSDYFHQHSSEAEAKARA